MDSDNLDNAITELTKFSQNLDITDDKNLGQRVKNLLDVLRRSALSVNREERLKAILPIRKLLSANQDFPRKEIIASPPMIAILVEGLKQDSDSNLQFEAAWALTNIAYGGKNETQTLVRAGVVEHLVRLLRSPQMNVCEQALWALGNIISDGAECREYVLRQGFINHLLVFVNPNTKLSFLRNIAWVIRNLCENIDKPLPDMGLITKLTPALLSFIQHTDHNIIADTIWTVSSISGTGPEHLGHIIDCGIIPYIIPLMHDQDPDLMIAALHTLGTIATGTEDQTQVIVVTVLFNAAAFTHFGYFFLLGSIQWGLHPPRNDINVECQYGYRVLGSLHSMLFHRRGVCRKQQLLKYLTLYNTGVDKGVLLHIPCLLDQSDEQIKKEATWLLSNITAGNELQIDALIQSNMIPKVIYLLEHSEFRTQKEIVRCLSNISNKGNQEQVRYLLHQNATLPLINMLKCNNVEIVRLCSAVIKKLLEHCTCIELKDLTLAIEESKGLDCIKQLKLHVDEEIVKTVHEIIDLYFHPNATQMPTISKQATNIN